MFIEQITLQNIKSYGSTPTTIHFKQGVNLIAGANGAGKSTILEAIGFVLFDALPYSQGDFERRGKLGATKITIRLHSTYDNRVYDVERAIPARYKVIDVQDHIDEGIQSKDDLLEWLCQHLKIEGKEDLKSLFVNAVGVQQGTITSIFLDKPSPRKDTFDALLRVQDFEQAWNELGNTKKYVADLLNNNANEIARKEGQTERLPDLETSVKATRSDIASKEEEFEELVAKLQILKISLEQLDQQKQLLDQLNRQLEQVNTNIEHLEGLLATAQDAYKKSQIAHEITTKNDEAHRLYKEAVEHLKELEEQHKKRGKIIEEKRTAEKKIDTTKLQIEQLEKVLVEVEAAEARLIELEPLVQQQEQLEHEQKQLLDEQKERDRLQEQVADEKPRRDSLQNELEELRGKVNQRSQLGEQVEQLRQQEDNLTTQINELFIGRYPLEQELERAHQVFDKANERFEEYKRLRETIDQQEAVLEKTEKERQQISVDLARRKELDEKINDIDGRITHATGEKTAAERSLPHIAGYMEELQQMREMLGEEGALCPVCRRSMEGSAHTEAIVYYDTQEQKFIDERQQAQNIISRLQISLEIWRPERALLEIERDAVANQVALTSIEGEIAKLQGNLSNLQTSLTAMEDAPQVRSNVEAVLNAAREKLDQHNNRINELTFEQTKQVKQIADLNEEIANLPSQDELKRQENEYSSLVEKITLSEKRLNKLVGVDNEVQRLKSELDSLNNPRENQAIARNTANKREALENEYQENQNVFASAQSEFEKVQEKLQVYENLDDDLESTRNQRDSNTEGYQLYIENKQIADLLTECESQLTKVQADLADATVTRDDFAQQHDEMTKDFDLDQYESFQTERADLETKQTKFATQIEILKDQLSKAEDEIEKLRIIGAQIQELQTMVTRLKDEQATFEFVRKSIREAGPRIRKRKVQLVSEVSANYFSEIINDFTMRLHWDTDDYGIYLEQSGEKRPFNVLSGGEQMIAALSIRLALLTHMTRISLIFLDEPTINLDENRRIQLAERLRQIKGLQQLFVISHDDTFIGESNHVINVIKEDGVSRVEMSHASLY